MDVEQQAFEIRRHLDVHRRRGRGHHLAQLVGAGRDRAREDVVDVGCNQQAVDGQAHAERDIARIDITEIAGRYGEGDLSVRRAECDRSGEIVHHLCDDPRPVDGIHAGEPRLVAKGVVVEHALHDGLAIVERSLDRQRVDIIVLDRRHHPPLHIGNAALRKKHEQVRAHATAKGLDRCPAGVSGSRDHDGRALSARGQRLIHEPAKELHRQILERERGPMKQFE